MTGKVDMAVLNGEVAGVRLEQTRMDAKTATLTSLAGGGLAFLVTQMGSKEPLAVRVVLAAAGVALLAAAVVLLACVVRPRLGTSGFCRWATMDAAKIGAVLADDAQVAEIGPEDLRFLSVIALTKQRRLRVAVDLLIAGFVLVGVALVAGVIV